MVLADPSKPLDSRLFSTSEWIAGALRRFAERLHPSTIAVPTPQDVARQELEEAQHQMLVAEKEVERWASTVQMLQSRVDRLRGYLQG